MFGVTRCAYLMGECSSHAEPGSYLFRARWFLDPVLPCYRRGRGRMARYGGRGPARRCGVPAFQVPGVIEQLRAAGYIVRKAKPSKPMTGEELDALLAELEA